VTRTIGPVETAGTVIDRYQLLQKIGEGGLAGQKEYADAEPLLLGGYQGMAVQKSRMLVAEWYHLDRARDWIVELYEGWGKPTNAATGGVSENDRRLEYRQDAQMARCFEARQRRQPGPRPQSG
jgi:hypothetical protein